MGASGYPIAPVPVLAVDRESPLPTDVELR